MDILLKLIDVGLTYNANNTSINVLKNINLDIKFKETISVIGESGSGKTSLIMLIGGLEKNTSGKIFFMDDEISKLSEEDPSKIRKKNIGIIFQSFYLIPNYTALENVSLTLEINGIKDPIKKSKDILSRFGLANRMNHLPSQLSGGEQQRVAIARSVAMKPKLILADEPTGNLDNENTKMVSDMLFEYVNQEKASLILVTHDQKLANKTKKIIHINDGQIVK